MAKMFDKTRFEGWEDFDWMDLYPEVGAFVSPTRGDYEIHGEIINALNYEHARHSWLWRKLEESGEERGTCCHCNKRIRYAVIYKDRAGKFHIVGQECSQFISSGLDLNKYRELQFSRDIKKTKTKNGEKYTYSDEVPAKLWDLSRENRPKFISLSKFTPPGRNNRPKWYYTIWGDNRDEVVEHYHTLLNLLK